MTIIPWKMIYYSRIKRINFEIPKSRTAKNAAKKTTVDSTVSVERVSSPRFGQLTFLISRIISLKNLVMRCISVTPKIYKYLQKSMIIISFLYEWYGWCRFCRIFSILISLFVSACWSSNNFASRKQHRKGLLFYS